IGLAAVVLLIAFAGVVIRSALRERPVSAIGAPKADVVANMAIGNLSAEPATEPLAELGVAPSSNTAMAASAN
ncbi:MAG TPA: hypothetical protein VFQ57_06090, partial [Sphingomonas sp.]|nr:hypothetical protein [Sphingomonas sp.]